jgi:2-polyprenyl-6-methoxyphenol hydroxylase-like FAD-dependent oxidoreductase
METVLIIGAGPAGMACALALRQRGFNVSIVDRRRQRSPLAKATGVNRRCCLWLAEQGIDLRSAAIPMRRFVFHDDDKLVADVQLPLLRGDAPAYLFPQAELERRMEAALVKQGISVRYALALSAIKQRNGMPLVTLQASDGSLSSEQADWVIGADGGHSTLRQMLGVPFVGRDYPEAWQVAEVETANWDSSAQARLYLHGDGRGLFLSQPSPGVIQGILNGPDVVEAMRARLPDARVRYVRDFRVALRRVLTPCHGRFWLIGDAAHTQSPVGGQGLNLAIRDAVTLGSSLGKQPPKTIERQLIAQARRTLTFTDFDYRLLSTRSRLLRYARNSYWNLAARHPWIAHWFFKLIAGQ